jgi:trigger factor
VGNFQTLEELRKQINDAIQHQRRHAATEAAKDKLVDTLLAKHDFPAPAKLVDRQIATRVERQLRALARQGVDASKLNIDWPKIRETEREGAARDVRAGLLLERIADVENVQVTSEEIDEQVKHYATQAKQPVAAARAKLAEDGTLDRMRAHIRNEKTLNFLFDEAQKVDQEVEAG